MATLLPGTNLANALMAKEGQPCGSRSAPGVYRGGLCVPVGSAEGVKLNAVPPALAATPLVPVSVKQGGLGVIGLLAIGAAVYFFIFKRG